MKDLFTGEVSGMAFGGQGLLRHDHLVVFIPFTVPGDKVTCRITQRKKNYAQAEVIQFDQLGPERIVPKCPYFGICGGCQLQHISYAAQLEYKRQWVEETLKRVGQLDLECIPPVIPAQEQWAYRRHITLSLQPCQKSFEAGYFATDNYTLLPVAQCPIFAAAADPILQQIQEIAGSLQSSANNEGRVTLLKNSDGTYLIQFQFKFMPKNALPILQKAISHYSHWSGIGLKSKNGSLSLGQTTSSLEIEGLHFHFSPRAFIQNHPEQSLKIYRMIRELATHSRIILDLYSGIGISSLLLAAQNKKVIGVEGNPKAVVLAKDNATLNHLSSIQFIRADVKHVLKKLLREQRPDMVILNPPRTGVEHPILKDLIAESPQEILYISCMPSTLARDLRVLCEEKYKVTTCQAFDMFPQTGHIETLVKLTRGN